MEAVLAADPPAEFPAEIAASVDAWIASAVERAAPLTFSEIRKGVQALSRRYTLRRDPGDALASPAKRAAFAAYFAPLHLATAYGVVRALPERGFTDTARIVDLGAGSGAAGAGAALAAPSHPPILALERSGFALAEARRTYAAFGLRGETQRAQLPLGIPKLARGDVALLGWLLNECDDDARERVFGALERGLAAGARVLVLEPLAGRVVPWWDEVAARFGALERGLAAGARVLVLEPLAGRVVPWWDEVAARFAALGCASGSVRWTMQRPEFVARMDKAAQLDHRELGARVLFGPLGQSDSEMRA